MASVQDSVTNAAGGFLKEQEKNMSPAGIVGNIAQDPEIAHMMELAEAAMPGFKDQINEAIGSLQSANWGDLSNLNAPGGANMSSGELTV